MVKVKVCGVTNEKDAQAAVKNGAWAIGCIFTKKSPRYVSPSKARKIIEHLPPLVTPVGVFVNQKEREIKDICRFTRIQTVQFHGDEDASFCKRFKDFKIIKAFRVGEHFDFAQIAPFKVDAYLFDTFQEDSFGGTGRTFRWEVLNNQNLDRPFILSGGLNPQNIRQALEMVNPYAVDVSSGVEKSPGIKNPRLIKDFIEVLNFPIDSKVV